MILHVVEAHVCGTYRLRLSFNDGTSKVVDSWTLLDGPMFEPIRDPAYFALVKVDPICGTVVWPNGADLAPEALKALAAIEERIEAAQPPRS
jgi:Protein of unknown function (DUF2442)